MTLTYYSKVYNGNINYSQINFGQWMKPEGTCISNQIKPLLQDQHAKKVVSDSPGLVDFAIGLMNFVLNLPDGLVNFFLRYSNYRRIVKSVLPIQMFLGLVEMMFGVIHASFSFLEWQALKMTFFAPWGLYKALMLSGIFHIFSNFNNGLCHY